MAQNTLQAIPSPGDLKTVAECVAYIKKLHSALSQWQLSLNNTKFLGSAEGNLFIDTDDPAKADGNDGDVWISY